VDLSWAPAPDPSPRPLTLSLTLYVVLVIFVAMLVQSAIGFGAGMIGVLLLALRLPVAVAAPLVTLLSVTVALIIVVQDHGDVDFRSVAVLVVSSLFGIPLGFLLLKYGDPHMLKAALAVLLMAFSLYCLYGGERVQLKSDNSLWLCGCGFLAGLLGQAFGMSGPPLIIYGAMRRWTAACFRATGQGFFLPSCIVMMVGFRLGGQWDWTVTSFYLYSLPAAVLSVAIGRIANRRLQKQAFHRYLYMAVAVIAAVLLFQATGGWWSAIGV
jgi:uncharacterized protein